MRSSSLQGKTVRPGLLTYSSYHSQRRPAARKIETGPKSHKLRKFLLFAVLLGVFMFGFQTIVKHQSDNIDHGAHPAAPAGSTVSGRCAKNTSSQLVLVSVSARHLWACQGGTTLYDSPVVTGMENLPADKTPRGNYHIYAKQTNTTLTGQDSTGKWSDPVYYWMPFLNNQYGTYGFHDATWRLDSVFGHIDPNSAQASHGCVELPLAASKWLYDWSQVGTAVTIEN